MKRFVRSFSACLMALLVLVVAVTPAKAASYTYKVRISTGNSDYTFANGKTYITLDKVNYKDELFLADTLATIDMSNSKYYIKGLRIAGTDEILASNIRITEDTDLVVAYGLSGTQMEYTVSYVDEDGNKLYEDATFSANADEVVYVACRYISGYLPDAFNKSFTLTAEKNHITFTYHVDENAIYNTYYGADSYEYGAAGVTIIEIPVAGGQGGAAANTPDGGNPAAQGNNPADNGAVIDDGNTPLAPQDIVNLDEEDTPLASADEVITNYAPWIAGAITAVAVLGLLALLLVMKKNKIGPFANSGKHAE